MRTVLLTAALLLVALRPLSAAIYQIDIHSPRSWAHYYTLIGLGNVDMLPVPDPALQRLEAHCAFLEEVTGLRWVPLGYSIERGFKLCYRTTPYSLKEARVLCARLVMHVKRNTPSEIVCERAPQTSHEALPTPGRPAL